MVQQNLDLNQLPKNYGELFIMFLDFYIQYEFVNLELQPFRAYQNIMEHPVRINQNLSEIGPQYINIIDPLNR